MLHKVWKNIGFCEWEKEYTVKNLSEEEMREYWLGAEEETDCICPIKEDPVKS